MTHPNLETWTNSQSLRVWDTGEALQKNWQRLLCLAAHLFCFFTPYEGVIFVDSEEKKNLQSICPNNAHLGVSLECNAHLGVKF